MIVPIKKTRTVPWGNPSGNPTFTGWFTKKAAYMSSNSVSRMTQTMKMTVASRTLVYAGSSKPVGDAPAGLTPPVDWGLGIAVTAGVLVRTGAGVFAATGSEVAVAAPAGTGADWLAGPETVD